MNLSGFCILMNLSGFCILNQTLLVMYVAIDGAYN